MRTWKPAPRSVHARRVRSRRDSLPHDAAASKATGKPASNAMASGGISRSTAVRLAS